METPLRTNFSNFKDFFPFLPMVHRQRILPLGYDDKPYDVLWLLQGGQLYMADIQVLGEQTDEGVFKEKYGHTWKEIYSMLERYTGSRFDRAIPVENTEGLTLRFGLMPATWFSGSLCVKRDLYASEHNYFENYQEWKKQPFQQLIFRCGRLQRVVNHPNTPDE